MNTQTGRAFHNNEYAYKTLCFLVDLMQNVDSRLEIHMFCYECAHSWNNNVLPTGAIL